MNKNIQGYFQICISVPLKRSEHLNGSENNVILKCSNENGTLRKPTRKPLSF